jgi:hypothetical protein
MDAKDKYGGSGGKSDVYFWVVPARAAGTWQWQSTVSGKPTPYEIRLEQKYQSFTGSVWVGGRTATLRNPRLRGPEIQFDFTVEVNGAPVRHEFIGKVEGEAINGTASLSGARLQSKQEWSARRVVRSAASTGPSPANSVRN